MSYYIATLATATVITYPAVLGSVVLSGGSAETLIDGTISPVQGVFAIHEDISGSVYNAGTYIDVSATFIPTDTLAFSPMSTSISSITILKATPYLVACPTSGTLLYNNTTSTLSTVGGSCSVSIGGDVIVDGSFTIHPDISNSILVEGIYQDVSAIFIPSTIANFNTIETTIQTLTVTSVDISQLKTLGISATDLKSAGYSSEDMKAAEYTATELKAVEYTATELKAALFLATELKSALFTASEMKAALYSATEMKAALFTAIEMKVAEYTATEMKAVEYTATEMNAALYSAIEMKSALYSAIEMKAGLYSATEMKAAEYTATELKAVGYTATEMKAAEYTATELKAALYSATEMKAALYTSTELKAVDYTISEQKAAGYTAIEERAANYTLAELAAAGYSATEMKAAQFTSTELKSVNYTIAEQKFAGYTATDMSGAQYTLAEQKSAGYTAAQERAANYTLAELTTAGYSATEMRAAQYTATELNSVGFTLAQQKFAGYTAAQEKAANYTLAELATAGYSATEMKAAQYTSTDLRLYDYTIEAQRLAGYTATDMSFANYTLAQQKAGGYTATQEKEAKHTIAELKTVGYTATEMKAALYTANELKAAYFTLPELIVANFTTSQLKLANYTPAELIAAGIPINSMYAAFTTTTEKRSVTKVVVSNLISSDTKTTIPLTTLVGYSFASTVKSAIAVKSANIDNPAIVSRAEMANGVAIVYAVLDVISSYIVLPTWIDAVNVMSLGNDKYRIYDSNGITLLDDNLVAGDTRYYNGLTVVVGSVTATLAPHPNVDFILSSLDSAITLSQSGKIPDNPNASLMTDATITLSTEVPATVLQNTFFFRTDNPIATIDASFVYHYVDTTKWTNQSTALSPRNGLVTRNGYVSNDTGGRDFLRDIARQLFGTYLAADLFTNETEVVEDINSLFDSVATNIMSLLSSIDISNGSPGAMSVDEFGKKYMKDDISSNNISRELLTQLITSDPTRFANIKKNYLYNSTEDGFYRIPIIPGDTISFMVTLWPAPGQTSIVPTTKKTSLTKRSYTVILKVS